MNLFNKVGDIFNKGFEAVKNQVNNINDTLNKNSGYITSNTINKNSNIPDLSPMASQNFHKLQDNNPIGPNTLKTGTSLSEALNITKKKPEMPDQEFMKGYDLINGEKIIDYDNAGIKIDGVLFNCKILLTNFRLYIQPDFKQVIQKGISYNNYYPENYFSLPIYEIEKNNKILEGLLTTVVITMKNSNIINLVFKMSIDSDNFLNKFYRLLSTKEEITYSNLARDYNLNHPLYKKETFENGWDLYDPSKEFKRQGIDYLDLNFDENQNNKDNKEKIFKKSNLNENFGLCSTYPQYLVTLRNIQDYTYKNCSSFRTKERVPTLTYYNFNTKGTIWRSSQPKPGVKNNRNISDEELLTNIANMSPSKKLIVYDCRPYLNAMANRLKGAGFELVEFYPNSEIIFCEIENIHAARNSIKEIYKMLINPKYCEDKKAISNFEATGWPNFIYGIIKSSIDVANNIKNGDSVLIHCSDGWDRASQVTAFSQLLIDPYFRTIKGYMSLIEKDFLSFGHQFKFRNGFYSKVQTNENQNSPIFLQYLDATHQLLVQYPMYFEFNMKFLLFIANAIGNGLYGTFLFNNEKERLEQKAKTETMSCWTEILNNINEYKNPFYDSKTKDSYFFCPSFAFGRIRLWEEYFMAKNQLNLCLSYDNYVNKYEGNFFSIFGQVKPKSKKLISNIMLLFNEKEEYNKHIEEKNKEILSLKKALMELTINNNIKKDIYDSLSSETQENIKNIVRDNKGKYVLNEEENIYAFQKTKNMFEGIDKLPEENLKEKANKKDNENPENLQQKLE